MTFFIKLLIFISIFNLTLANNQSIDKDKFIENPRIILVDIGGTLLTVDVLKFPKYFGFFDLLNCTIGNLFMTIISTPMMITDSGATRLIPVTLTIIQGARVVTRSLSRYGAGLSHLDLLANIQLDTCPTLLYGEFVKITL